MDADGSNVTRLTWSLEERVTPRWSPDGNKIMFVEYTSSRGKIKTMDASNGNNIVNLSSTNGLNGHDQSPAWSPDGSRIAFYSSLNAIHQEDEIWVMNSDGTLGNPSRLTFSSWSDYDPTWSPDGSKIAFRRATSGADEIHVLNASSSSGDSTNITNNSVQDGVPSWSR